MKTIYHIAILAMMAVVAINSSAQTLTEAWSNMPIHITPSIGKNARLDMIDLYNAGMTAKVATFTGDTACLITLEDTYLHLRTSKASTLQIKQIKEGKKLYYAAITTIEGPAPNSHLDLYNEKWQPIALNKHFTPATVADFIALPKNAKNERNNLLKKITLPTIEYRASNDTNDIIAIPSFLQTLDEETRKEIEDYIHQQLTLRWKNKKWKLAK